jgi:hypothetical protein
MMLVRRPRIRTMMAAGVAGLAAIGTVAATAVPASAAGSPIHAVYKVTGSTFLNAPDATLPLGPGRLAANLNASTGKIRATLTMPDATLNFMEFGTIPVTATARLINDGPTTGTLNLNTGAVTTTSNITFQIVSLSVAGVPVLVGPACESATPASIQVTSQPGFNILKGGNLSGTYTIPQFANCLLVTPLINLTLTGPNNTITLTLGKAKIST